SVRDLPLKHSPIRGLSYACPLCDSRTKSGGAQGWHSSTSLCPGSSSGKLEVTPGNFSGFSAIGAKCDRTKCEVIQSLSELYS
ncbi:DNA excision repair protein ERCC-6-like 2, partial [Clarias magur]